MLQKVPTTPIPREAKGVLRATKDLHESFSRENIRYCVIGSMAVVGAIGRFHRIPADVDVLYDFDKRSRVKKSLRKLGYKLQIQDNFKGTFQYPLEQYNKGRQVIEPRPVYFADNGIEVYFKLPIPFLPKFLWPWPKLCFKSTMSIPKLYKTGGVEFFGLKKEACFVALNSFMGILNSFDDKVQKRKMDLSFLSRGLNKSILKKIEQEFPGIYLGKLPIAVGKEPLLLRVYSKLKNLKNLLNPTID
ncbi:MAG: hypothetical protein Q7R44_00630 [bacterium]|nr:hypothetical protein [bacterium]